MNKEFDPSKLIRVDINKVHPNSWNPKTKQHEKVSTIEDSIKKHGFKQPIQVRNHPDIKNEYEIIDGEQRWTAMSNIDAKFIYVYSNGNVKDSDAMNETLWWQIQIPFKAIEHAKLVNELEALEMELPYSLKELTNIKSALEPKSVNQEDSQENTNRLNIKLSSDQFDVIMQAINSVKDELNCQDAYALEMICAEYINS